MLLSPMNRATTSVAGFVAIVNGLSTCWMRASFMTTMRSAIESASSWLCVTWMNMRPSCRWRLRSSTRILSCSRRSRSPSGSSSRSAFGFVTSTRASATRCCCPPESALGFRSARGVRPTTSSASNARFRRSSFPTPCILRPNSTFESTDRCGKRAKCWKTVVVGRLCGGRSTSDSPSRTMSPELGNSWPPIIRSVVVLPQPDGPSRTTYSPWSTCRLTSSTATMPPGKTLVSPTRSRPDPCDGEGAADAAPSDCDVAESDIRLGGQEVVRPLGDDTRFPAGTSSTRRTCRSRFGNEPPSLRSPFLMSPTLPVMPGRSRAAGLPFHQ